jgi:hypothetical protein
VRPCSSLAGSGPAQAPLAAIHLLHPEITLSEPSPVEISFSAPRLLPIDPLFDGIFAPIFACGFRAPSSGSIGPVVAENFPPLFVGHMKPAVSKGTRQAKRRDTKPVVRRGTEMAGKRDGMKPRRRKNRHRQRMCEPSWATTAAGRRCFIRKKSTTKWPRRDFHAGRGRNHESNRLCRKPLHDTGPLTSANTRENRLPGKTITPAISNT